jgi:hypothetical protein
MQGIGRSITVPPAVLIKTDPDRQIVKSKLTKIKMPKLGPLRLALLAFGDIVPAEVVPAQR